MDKKEHDDYSEELTDDSSDDIKPKKPSPTIKTNINTNINIDTNTTITPSNIIASNSAVLEITTNERDWTNEFHSVKNQKKKKKRKKKKI